MSRGGLEPGWADLAAGRWQAAREFFAQASAVEASPEALEGLSWAAWWSDDAEAVFDARERAYRAYERAGDAAAAARMATWLACDHLDFRGATSVAGGWLARAQRLLEPLEPGVDHGWLAFFDGYMALGAGEAERAAELARRASALGRRCGVPDLEMIGLALEGASHVSRAEVRTGMRCLEEATATALEADARIPIASAWACCFMVSACAAVRDYERAWEWCDRIAEFAERYGSRYMLAFCRAEYGSLHLWHGRWTEAERVLVESLEDFEGSRPAMVAAPLAGLAELRRRQGRPADAALLLDRAGPVSAAHLCRARLALDAGDAVGAAELAERLLRQLPADAGVSRAPALEVLARARCAHDDPEGARAAAAELRAIATRVGTTALRACADVVDGIAAAAAGEHAAARPLLEDGVDGLERSGGVFEAGEARVALAAALHELGRDEVAEREAAAARERLAALGATVVAARAAQLLGEIARSRGRPVPGDVTPRERDVLRLLADGLTNAQIAEQLVVSEHTVHRHVTNILRKLDVPTRAAAAAHAVRAGVVSAPRE